LIDLYPTLNDLCELPEDAKHDGVSLVPLLRNPDKEWERPAVVQFKSGNVAVRSDRFRYIRYRDGSEEFYDLEKDPYEWTNLADDAEFASSKEELAHWATEDWAKSAPTKSAFEFDPTTFTWKEKSSGQLIEGASTIDNP
jgi:arylsulfatase A-like enzyme